MLEVVLFSVAFVLLVISAVTDIRTREVPDWTNLAGIVAGLGIRLLWSLQTNEWRVLGLGVLGFVAFFALALVMYYSGQWGGGDSKLLMAMGALFGIEFSLQSAGLTFLLWSLLAGAGYGLVWSLALAAAHWKFFVRQYSKLSSALRWAHLPVLGVFVLGFAFAIASDDQLFRIVLLVVAISVPVLFYAAIGVKAVEQCCMLKTYPVGRLTEGDWIAKPVRVNGKEICGPKDLGITKEKIQELKRLRVREVLVKEGIPFAPTFLIAFALMVMLGSPLRWFV